MHETSEWQRGLRETNIGKTTQTTTIIAENSTDLDIVGGFNKLTTWILKQPEFSVDASDAVNGAQTIARSIIDTIMQKFDEYFNIVHEDAKMEAMDRRGSTVGHRANEEIPVFLF